MTSLKSSPSLVRIQQSDIVLALTSRSDWQDSETDLAHLGSAAPGAAKSGGDKLWEDNWDDDDIEDEFSVQLRYVTLVSSDRHLTGAFSGESWRRQNLPEWNNSHKSSICILFPYHNDFPLPLDSYSKPDT